MIRPVVSLITGLLCALLLTLPARGQGGAETPAVNTTAGAASSPPTPATVSTPGIEWFRFYEQDNTGKTVGTATCIVGVTGSESANSNVRPLCRYDFEGKAKKSYRDRIDVKKIVVSGQTQIEFNSTYEVYETGSMPYNDDIKRKIMIDYIRGMSDDASIEPSSNVGIITAANTLFHLNKNEIQLLIGLIDQKGSIPLASGQMKEFETQLANPSSVTTKVRDKIKEEIKRLLLLKTSNKSVEASAEGTIPLEAKKIAPENVSAGFFDKCKNYNHSVGEERTPDCKNFSEEIFQHYGVIKKRTDLIISAADPALVNKYSVVDSLTVQTPGPNGISESHVFELAVVGNNSNEKSLIGFCASMPLLCDSIADYPITVIVGFLSVFLLLNVASILLFRLSFKRTLAVQGKADAHQSPDPSNFVTRAEEIVGVLTRHPLLQSKILGNGTIDPQTLRVALNQWEDDVRAFEPLRKRLGETADRTRSFLQGVMDLLAKHFPGHQVADLSRHLDSRLLAIQRIEQYQSDGYSQSIQQKIDNLLQKAGIVINIAGILNEQNIDDLQDRVNDIVNQNNDNLRKLEGFRSKLQLKLFPSNNKSQILSSTQRPEDGELISQVEKTVTAAREWADYGRTLKADLDQRDLADKQREVVERRWNDSVAQVMQDWLFLPIPSNGEATDAGPQPDHPVKAAIARLLSFPNAIREVWLEALKAAGDWQGVRRRLQSPDHLELFEELGIDGTVDELKKIIQRIDSFGRPYRADQIGMEFWEHVLLPCFVSGWAHRLLRADLLLRSYYADDARIREFSDMVSVIAALFRRLSKDAGVELHLGRLLEPHDGSTRKSSEHPTERFRSLQPVRAVVLQLIEEGRLDTVIDMSQVGFNCDSERLDLKVRLINRSEWVS
jgi:hypothetical protein